MKNTIIGFIAMAFTINVYSQTAMTLDEGKVKLVVYYSYERNLSSEKIVYDQISGYTLNYNRPNFNVGVNAGYGITEDLFIVSGINYSDKSFTGIYYCTVCDLVSLPQPEKIEFQFIEIPITAKHHFLNSRFKIFGEAGIVNIFAIGNETVMKNKNYLISARIGGGVDYSLLHEFSLQLSMDYTHNLSTISKKVDYTYQVVGIKLGISKKL